MKKVFVIVLVLIIGLALVFMLAKPGFKNTQQGNLEARQTPIGTTEKTIELYKNSDELSKELMVRFHSEDFEDSVDKDELLEFWKGVLPATDNTTTQLLSQDENYAVVEVTSNQTGKKFQVYLGTTVGSDHSTIWEISGYKNGVNTLGDIQSVQ